MKKGFTLIELLITTTLIVLLSVPLYNSIAGFKQSDFDNLKQQYIKETGQDLVNKIVNIRDSAWIESSNRNVDNLLEGEYCSSKVSKQEGDSEILGLEYGWFCLPVDIENNVPISDLDGNYRITDEENLITGENNYRLQQVDEGEFSGFLYIDYASEKRIEGEETLQDVKDFFERRKNFDIQDFNEYIDADEIIPRNLLLYNIVFLDTVESDFENIIDLERDFYNDGEKQYFLDQSKKAVITIEYSNKRKTREKYVIEKVLTNYLSN